MHQFFSGSSSQLSIDSSATSDDNDSESLSGDHDTPVYEGASLTVSQFNCAFLALTQKHNLPSQAIENILKFLQLILPQGNKCCSSSYRCEKSLSELHFSYKKYITCHACQTPLDNGICTNSACAVYETNGTGEGSNTFFVISVLKELEQLILGENFLRLSLSVSHIFWMIIIVTIIIIIINNSFVWHKFKVVFKCA